MKSECHYADGNFLPSQPLLFILPLTSDHLTLTIRMSICGVFDDVVHFWEYMFRTVLHYNVCPSSKCIGSMQVIDAPKMTKNEAKITKNVVVVL